MALGFVFDTIFLPFWKNDGDTDIHRQGGGNFLRFMSFFTLIYQNSITKISKANYVITNIGTYIIWIVAWLNSKKTLILVSEKRSTTW